MYDTEELKQKVLKAIEEHEIVFFKEIEAYVGVSRQTLYRKKFNKCYTIKESIQKNRVVLKSELRRKMYESNSPTAHIALYKLLATEDELHALNGTRIKTSNQSIDTTTAKLIIKNPYKPLEGKRVQVVD